MVGNTGNQVASAMEDIRVQGWGYNWRGHQDPRAGTEVGVSLLVLLQPDATDLGSH